MNVSLNVTTEIFGCTTCFPIPMMSMENQCVEMAFNSTDIPYRTMNSPSFGGSLGHVSMHVQLNLEVLHFQKITV